MSEVGAAAEIMTMITQRLVAFTKLIGLAFIVILCGHVGPYVHGEYFLGEMNRFVRYMGRLEIF